MRSKNAFAAGAAFMLLIGLSGAAKSAEESYFTGPEGWADRSAETQQRYAEKYFKDLRESSLLADQKSQARQQTRDSLQLQDAADDEYRRHYENQETYYNGFYDYNMSETHPWMGGSMFTPYQGGLYPRH